MLETHEQWNKQYLGDFKVNTRFNDLCDRLQEYYTSTPDSMNNKDAMKYWKLFKQWCGERGYTQEEINKAKRARKYNF